MADCKIRKNFFNFKSQYMVEHRFLSVGSSRAPLFCLRRTGLGLLYRVCVLEREPKETSQIEHTGPRSQTTTTKKDQIKSLQ